MDPYIGILHADLYDKPALTFDLIEPFRYVVEETVIKLYTGRKVHSEQILTSEENGAMLTLDGKKLLLASLDERLNHKRGSHCALEEMQGMVASFSKRMRGCP